MSDFGVKSAKVLPEQMCTINLLKWSTLLESDETFSLLETNLCQAVSQLCPLCRRTCLRTQTTEIRLQSGHSPKVAKVGPPRAMIKSAKVVPTSYA